MLGGLDYDDNALWRFRLLLGGEARQFRRPGLPASTTRFIAEAETTWFPTQLTTLRVTLARDTQDAAQEGVSGLVYSGRADRRSTTNSGATCCCRPMAGCSRRRISAAGARPASAAGVGLTWSMNRHARLSLHLRPERTEWRPKRRPDVVDRLQSGLSLITFHFGPMSTCCSSPVSRFDPLTLRGGGACDRRAAAAMRRSATS